MLDFAFTAHFYVRYLVLLAAIVTALYASAGLTRKGNVDRGGIILLRGFAALVDIQVVLGILTLVSRPFYPPLIGHLVLMIAAAAVVHLGLVRLKQAVPERRTWAMLLMAALIPLLLMFAGILAIQRPII